MKRNTGNIFFLIFICCNTPQWACASSFTMFLDHAQRRTTVGRTPLDEWSARRRDLYLTTHTALKTDIHVPGGIRTHNLRKLMVPDPLLRPRGHWDRECWKLTGVMKRVCCFTLIWCLEGNMQTYLT